MGLFVDKDPDPGDLKRPDPDPQHCVYPSNLKLLKFLFPN